MSKLHTDVLILLRPVGQYGQALDVLLDDLRERRHRDLTLPQLERAARDLADKSFAEPFTSPLGKRRWRIAPLGETALNQEAL